MCVSFTSFLNETKLFIVCKKERERDRKKKREVNGGGIVNRFMYEYGHNSSNYSSSFKGRIGGDDEKNE